ncbi:MAG TPA: macro domain-containing protein [Nitrospiraceae bacterium]|nr:macro domain-containing protein [Nitrospiraceae bacterium]
MKVLSTHRPCPDRRLRIPADNVRLATRAAPALADEHDFRSLALPGMGTGVGGVSHADAAAMMVREIKSYSPRSLKSVILIDVDDAMVAAWEQELMADGV